MRCPYCLHDDTSVMESRPMVDEPGVRRRRVCGKCKKRFTTYERVGNLGLKVLKRNGDREPFSREKLEKGIIKACWKREVSDKRVEELIDEIEAKLLSRKTNLIKSSDIGNMVLTRLKKIDPVAYLRFASVYLVFEKLDDFKKIVTDLETSKDYQIDMKKNARQNSL